MSNQQGATPADFDFGPRRSILTAPGTIIGWRRDGRPIRLIAGASEPPPEGGDSGSDSGTGSEAEEDELAQRLLADAVASGETGDGDEPLGEKGLRALQRERRAKEAAEKAAREALTKVKEYEDRDKSELQKATEAREEAEKAAQKATTDALRYKIAAKHKISDEDADLFLTGSDEETISKQAARYAELSTTTEEPPPPPPRGYVPRSGTGGGTSSGGTVAAGREMFNSSRSTDRETEPNHA